MLHVRFPRPPAQPLVASAWRPRLARWLALLLLLTLVGGSSPTATSPRAEAGDFAAIDAYVAAHLRQDRIPGASLAIVQGDRIVHRREFGSAHPDGTPMTPDTLFIIGSISKSITALAVMQLVESGDIALDAPARRYLPWFRVADPEASARITVRHLLTHSSGLPETAAMEAIAEDGDLTLAGRVRTLRDVPLVAPPGAAFHYANADYLVLALIIEAASGQPYADYVRARILTPLEMRHTALSDEEAPAAERATGYRYWFGVPLAADLPYPQDLVPAGYILASSEDLAHFLIAQLNGGRYGDVAVLSPAGIAAMQRPETRLVPTIGYGTGWWIGPYNGATDAVPAFYHGGSTPQFRTYLIGIPEGRWGVVLLLDANSDLFRASLNEIPEGVASLLTGRPVPAGGPSFGTKYLLFDLAVLLATWLQLRVAGGLWRDRRPRQGALRRAWRALPLTWEIGLSLGLFAGLPNLTRLPWLAARLGAVIGIPGLGDLPWPLLLSLLPDLGYWMLAFLLLLFATGFLRLARCLAPHRQPRHAARVAVGQPAPAGHPSRS